jgi:hypothetical protein
MNYLLKPKFHIQVSIEIYPELSSSEAEGDDQRTLVLKLVIPSVLHLVKLRREQDFHGTKQ